MSVKYAMCVSCGNTHEGDPVYVCPECGHRFCESCRSFKCLGFTTMCPICETENPKQIGEIGNPNR